MNAKMQEGLANTYKESGFLPEWASPGHRGCMVGNNSASVVADAWLKGLRGYDIETLWNAVKSGTENVHPEVSSTGRLGHEYYNKLGYVPYNVGINEMQPVRWSMLMMIGASTSWDFRSASRRKNWLLLPNAR